jgi:hypothetical protein
VFLKEYTGFTVTNRDVKLLDIFTRFLTQVRGHSAIWIPTSIEFPPNLGGAELCFPEAINGYAIGVGAKHLKSGQGASSAYLEES